MSIPSRPPSFEVPDFRNLGVWLRLLLAANALMLALALAANRSLPRLPDEIIELAALFEPALLLTLVALMLLAPSLERLGGRRAAGVAVAVAMLAAAGVDGVLGGIGGGGAYAAWRAPLVAGVGAALLLVWFDLRARAHAPAFAEARLAALNARIRPHFFFNSLNGVLGVIREDPRRAEAALEELAELFRVLMRDNSELTSLSEEIALARKYLDIEKLRLGERLQVRWEVDDCPPDAQVPPLLLQPLLENAVYYGIEPAETTGDIGVRIMATRDGIRIEIDNPWIETAPERHGNHMALDNLRERLMLFYDLEARLDTGVKAGRYRVRIDLPHRWSAPRHE